MSPNAVAVRFSALGDLVLSTGVLEHWQSTLGLQFVFITKKDFSPILENHPSVAEIIALDRIELSGSAWLRQARRLASAYSGLPLIDLHGNLRTRVLRMLWKGKTYSYAKHSLTRRAFHRLRHDWARQRLLAMERAPTLRHGPAHAAPFGQSPPAPSVPHPWGSHTDPFPA